MYTLEKYSSLKSRYTCPSCNERHQFTRYVNIETNEQLAESVGICNRINSCGYHVTPKQYFQDNPNLYTLDKKCIQPKKIVYTSPSFIPQEYVHKSLYTNQRNALNYFILYLESLVGCIKAKELIMQFQIGTSKHWPGSTIFWQIDASGNTRTGKIMLYNPETGKRIKEPFSHIYWVHSKLLKENIVNTYCLQQCIFGLHQLYTASKTKTIGIVESEKSAIIASALLPELIWMATGGIQNLSSKMLTPLSNRKLILFPDLNACTLWEEKVNKIKQELNINICISFLLEQKASATDRAKGFDLADYLIKA